MDYLIKDNTLIGIADGVRDISGETENLSPSQMTTKLGNAGDEVDDQNGILQTLIQTIETKQKGEPDLIEKNVNANGTYTATDDEADGYSKVTVNVPPTPTQSKTLTLGADTPQTVAPDSGKVLSSVPVTLDTSVIKAENIKKDVQMLGITGAYEGSSERKASFVAGTMPFSGRFDSIAYGNGKFVAVGANTNKIVYSTGGVTWASKTISGISYFMGIAYGAGVFVAIGNSSVLYSTDGINWTNATVSTTTQWKRIVYGNGMFLLRSDTNAIAYSTDGINWLEASADLNGYHGIAYGAGKFVEAQTGYYCAYSKDGIYWTKVSTTSYGNSKVIYGGDKFITFSDRPATVSYSTDGITWSSANLPSINDNVDCGTWGNGLFILLTRTTNKVLYSSDGINWSKADMVSSSWWNSIAYGNGKFVAAGLNTNVNAYCDIRCAII